MSSKPNTNFNNLTEEETSTTPALLPPSRSTRSQTRRTSLPAPSTAFQGTSTTLTTGTSAAAAFLSLAEAAGPITGSSTRKRKLPDSIEEQDDEADEHAAEGTSAGPSEKAKGKRRAVEKPVIKRPRRSLPNLPSQSTEVDNTNPKKRLRSDSSPAVDPAAKYTLRSKGKGKETQIDTTKPAKKMTKKNKSASKKDERRASKSMKGDAGSSNPRTRYDSNVKSLEVADSTAALAMNSNEEDDPEDSDSDQEMVDDDEGSQDGEDDGAMDEDDDGDDRHDHNQEEDEEDDDDEDEEEDEDDPNGANPNAGGGSGSNAASRAAQDSIAAALFGEDYRALGGYMMGLSGRLKNILTSLRSKDSTIQLAALQEASELLSVSTEDTLAGYFSVESFVKEFVSIMDGKKFTEAGRLGRRGGMEMGDGDEEDEDASLARALVMSAADNFGGMSLDGDDGGGNLEAQLLACRCLANLMEALPGSAHTVVYNGAVPILCSKLTEIQYIELAEQTLSTLEKISEEYPSAIVREGGLGALLNFLDFFSTNVQRTAVTAAANCCRNVSQEHFTMVRDVFPMLRNVLGYPDQRLVEQACLAVVRSIESFRHKADFLETLLDVQLVTSINQLLLPQGGSPTISPATYTALLKSLTTAAKVSPKTTVAFLQAGMVGTLYQILTGVEPGADDEHEQGGAAEGQGLAGGLADMVVLQNLANRPKDQVEEALALISELMPPLPRDGVFDPRGYTEKALGKLLRAKARAERSSRYSEASSSATPATTSTSNVNNNIASILVGEEGASDASPAPPVKVKREADVLIDTRIELLRSNPDLTSHFMKVIVPVLIDVYAASVALRVRTKVLTALLKAVSFAEGEELTSILKSVPLASFLGSVMSSRDNPTLVLGALQLVELLMTKLPSVYHTSFRREGVLYEVELLSDQPLTTAQKEAIETPAVKLEPEDQAIPSTTSSSLPTASTLSSLLGADASFVSRSANSSRETINNLTFGASSSSTIKKPSSIPSDPNDANIIRARVLKTKASVDSDADGDGEAAKALKKMKSLATKLNDQEASLTSLRKTVEELAALFSPGGQPVSSFELLKSGLVDGLLECAIINGKASSTSRRRLLFEVFSKEEASGISPLFILVKRLQESLGRMESFDVVTAFHGSQNDDSRRSSTALLARQIRLKLQAAEGSDIPKSCSAMVVSIQAIATFQALNDYLRPRILAPQNGAGPGGRLPGMHAAYAAAAGLLGPNSRLAAALGGSSPTALAEAEAQARQRLQAAKDAIASAQATASGAIASSSTTAQALTSEPSDAGPGPSTLGRRRSARLSGKIPSDNAAAFTEKTELSGILTEGTGAEDGGEEHHDEPHFEFDEDAMDDEMFSDGFDDEMFDEEMDDGAPPADMTVSVAVSKDGSKVEAKASDGTKISTPVQAPPADSAPSATASTSSAAQGTPTLSSHASYAGALKTKPFNWHLEFSMGDKVIPLETTIYGAIHQLESRTGVTNGFQRGMWSGINNVTFKKVPGPGPAPAKQASPEPSTKEPSSATALPGSVAADSAQAKILRLLRVLHALNVEASQSMDETKPQTLAESAFVNNKLTAKLARQLEEPMIVASSCLPDWSIDLPQYFPFLFPFETRFSFLQSTSFGYSRLIQKWQSQQTRSNDSRRDDSLSFLGRPQRQKVRISRNHLLESAMKVFELYGSSSSVLEVEYFEEVGTGLGPTLEFYSLASKEFARKDLKLWRDADASGEGPYVHRPQGLFPLPISKDSMTSVGLSQIHVFKILGQFVAKALMDSRMIDMSFNRIFLLHVLDQDVPLTIESVFAVDKSLGRSLRSLQEYVQLKEALMIGDFVTEEQKAEAVAKMEINGVTVEDLSLDFTLPGYGIELLPGGSSIDVTGANIEEYVEKVIEFTLKTSVSKQIASFRAGFSTIFPVRDLQAFSPDELSILFGSAEEDWAPETLSEAIKADHGYNIESNAISNLIAVMSSYDAPTRREYLQFITGSPKLPIGGFKGLNPPLTVVRKGHEPPFKADDYLPSVMTCVSYLKLPDYSTKEVLEKKLLMAMREGSGSFHLS